MKHRSYCLGFAFDADLQCVALIRKARPNWQAGRLNGIGGHVEAGESPAQAMTREFAEEAGVGEGLWNSRFAVMRGDGWEVHCFCKALQRTDIWQLKNPDESEPIEIHYVSLLPQDHILGNVPWLVHMAKAYLGKSMNGWPLDIWETVPR